MSDKDSVLAGDGGVQVSPCGEFPHVGAGVTQVIDHEACDRIAADFNARKSDTNFPGVLVDFDHFSLDTESRARRHAHDADRERQRAAANATNLPKREAVGKAFAQSRPLEALPPSTILPLLTPHS